MSTQYVPSTWRRLAAQSVDGVILGAFSLPIAVRGIQTYLATGIFEVEWKWLVVSFTLQLLYKWLFLKFLGATIGKLLFGLRLVSRNGGGELGWLQALIRVITDSLSIFFGQATKVLLFLRFDRTHLSDWVAETRVIQFSPRVSPPHRRPVLTLVLFLYLAYSGFMQSYRYFQTTEWNRTSIKIDLKNAYSR